VGSVPISVRTFLNHCEEAGVVLKELPKIPSLVSHVGWQFNLKAKLCRIDPTWAAKADSVFRKVMERPGPHSNLTWYRLAGSLIWAVAVHQVPLSHIAPIIEHMSRVGTWITVGFRPWDDLTSPPHHSGVP